MNRHRALFEKHNKGELEGKRVEELHQYLVEIYFLSPRELNPAELEYTEDLVIELYLSEALEEKYARQFEEAISKNAVLKRKFHLLRNLGEANLGVKNNRISLLQDSEKTESDKKEEEQLSQILQEVIERVHSEKEAGQVKFKLENLLLRVKTIFEGLIPTTPIHQPQLRIALVFASILIIAGIVWVTIKPESEKLITEQTKVDSAKNDPLINTDSSKRKGIETPQRIPSEIQKPAYALTDTHKNKQIPKEQYAQQHKEPDTLYRLYKELDQALLACAEDIPASIEYVELRSLTSAANDLFINAAHKYENKEYDSCIIIMKGLLSAKCFRSPDSINEINFYLGVSYFAKGFYKPSQKTLKLALQSFGRIAQNSPFFNDSKWYSALAIIRMGDTTKGLRILDSLLQKNYVRSGEVKTLRDRMAGIIHN